jgi:hypothetical protein
VTVAGTVLDEDSIAPWFVDGNLAILVVVDSRREEYGWVPAGVYAALNHLGIPYRLVDLATGRLTAAATAVAPAFLFAQEALGDSLSVEEATLVSDAVRAGAGLVSLDPLLDRYQPPLREQLPNAGGGPLLATGIRTAMTDHYITATRAVGERVAARRPVPVWGLRGSGAVLLAADDGAALAIAGRIGEGRVVCLGCSARVWLQEYLGHANGLDDVFWKSIVWVARKPFVMRAMPYFITGRIDDVSGIGSVWWNVQRLVSGGQPLPSRLLDLLCQERAGEGSVAAGFQYLDILNRHGFVPNLGVFAAQLRPEEAALLADHQAAGHVEVSGHAFAEHFAADGSHVIDFIYQQSTRTGRGSPGLVECPPEDAAAKFARLDAVWQQTGLQPSVTVNSHYYNPGVHALPFLKARGQTFMMFWPKFGLVSQDPDAHQWRMAPYGHPGFVLDTMPDPDNHPDVRPGDFFCVQAHPYEWLDDARQRIGPDPDLLMDWYRPVAEGRIEGLLATAAERLAAHVRRGLDARFFGCFLTHEQRFALLLPEEFDQIFQVGMQGLRGYPLQFVGYDHIARYARARATSRLKRVTLPPDGVITLTLEGQAEAPTAVECFTDGPTGPISTWHTVGPFAGSVTIACPVR